MLRYLKAKNKMKLKGLKLKMSRTWNVRTLSKYFVTKPSKCPAHRPGVQFSDKYIETDQSGEINNCV